MRPKIPLPKLIRRRLDGEAVRAHFQSLAADATQIEVRAKPAFGAHSSTDSIRIDDAARMLISGSIVAVQVRFRQDEAWWCDTIQTGGDGFRLIRMRQGEED